MKKASFKKWTTLPYILAAALGLVLLPIAIKTAYIQRGYFAAGGELLIPFLFVLVTALAAEIKEVAKEIRQL